jgi:hypothetical protein
MHHTADEINATLAAVIRAYPSLRHTRMDAVAAILEDSHSHWDQHGNLLPAKHAITPSDRDYINRDDVKPADKLWYSSCEAVEQYFRDNADMIARTPDFRDPFPDEWCDGFGFGTTLLNQHKSFDMLDSLPENVNPLWMDIFIQFFKQVLDFRFNSAYIARYPNSTHYAGLEKAKEKARNWLIKLSGSEKEKSDLTKKIINDGFKKLKDQAARTGVNFTKIVSENLGDVNIKVIANVLHSMDEPENDPLSIGWDGLLENTRIQYMDRATKIAGIVKGMIFGKHS